MNICFVFDAVKKVVYVQLFWFFLVFVIDYRLWGYGVIEDT
jgi:hypothetical protein